MPPARIPTLSADDSLNARRVTCHQPLAGIWVGTSAWSPGRSAGPAAPPVAFAVPLPPTATCPFAVGAAGAGGTRWPGAEGVGVRAADRRLVLALAQGRQADHRPGERLRARHTGLRAVGRISGAGRSAAGGDGGGVRRGTAVRTSGGGTRGSSGGADGPERAAPGVTRVATATRLQPLSVRVESEVTRAPPRRVADRSGQGEGGGPARHQPLGEPRHEGMPVY